MDSRPKAVGDRATLAIMLVLEASGFRVYTPFTENTRCDLVIDGGGRLSRIQCKSGRLRDGAVRFNTCSTYAHHPHPKVTTRDYRGEVDYFAIYCHETGAVYLVPIEDLPVTREGSLRVERARNGQRLLVRMASTYELGSVNITSG